MQHTQPNMVTSSASLQYQNAAQLQQQLANRIVPGVLQIPAGTTQLGALRGSGGGGLGDLSGAIHQAASDPYGVDQFEPTPINPHAQIRVAQLERNDRPAPAPQARGLQRDNSLTFENLFAKDSAAASSSKPNKRAMEGSSQHLSAMSFSIGDMTDASNLSAVFEDSMRISDDAAAELRYEKSRQLQHQQQQALPSTSTMDKLKPHAAHSNTNIDMSVASLGSLGLESSMMHMSFKSGFDEDLTKDGR
jgi:hypothetical protein